jgi:hypothetical protein
MSLFEPEETVGKYWHRLIGSTSTYPRHPEAAVPLEAVQARLGVMFRARRQRRDPHRLGRADGVGTSPEPEAAHRTRSREARAPCRGRHGAAAAGRARRVPGARGQRGAARMAGRVVFPSIARLPAALPAIYRHITN